MNAELKPYHEIVPDAEVSDQWAFALEDKYRCENCESDHVAKNEFLVFELYCPEPDCSCREVALQVLTLKDGVADYTGGIMLDLNLDQSQKVTWRKVKGITEAGSSALKTVESRLKDDETFYQSLQDHWSNVRRSVSEQRHQEMLLLRKKRRKLLGKSRRR